MNEQKELAPLTIQHLELTADGRDFIVRFSAAPVEFQKFVAELKAEGYQYARWDPTALENRGAWRIDFSVFKSHAEKFNNYELRASRAVDRFFNRPTRYVEGNEA